MILTVYHAAMWGLKVKYENKNEFISPKVTYEIIFPNNEGSTFKNPTNPHCNEFINKDIQNWIFKNKLNEYEKGKPPKFRAELSGNKIVIGERIR